ncbi:D-tyrosyl-tRNA(Tyr) deacylase [Peptoniphilus sp. KCTC 25270]|uniref:D-aminoacyl-tRNA deacylase n=1 Tax=Peptoniphilus sp. KCTC 25270 TaxID=2897414 RepID=UPI001E516F37|nr:D-aminoacyl-tRNA deacylase [Peptoniphilus sp. KCTC 25270]MCD1147037.1 D-tyrosyl-tRNA(Tyr) deacylase [Peptoniphilus sp. KCTC 25270]
MRAVVQRVKEAFVKVDTETTGTIGPGLLVYLGITDSDEQADLDFMVKKVTNLRIFEDENDVMNRSLLDVGGSLLVVSQFTLYGDARKGNRPSYIRAAKGEISEPMYEKFVETCRNLEIEVETGRFGADMKVHSINDGPVTILLDSERNF